MTRWPAATSSRPRRRTWPRRTSLDAALELADGRDLWPMATACRSTTGPASRRPGVAQLGGGFWQLRLERPLVPAAGDRLVLRCIAPPDTLGGGVVLDPRARKHGPSREVTARLARLARGEPDPPPSRGARGRARRRPGAEAPLGRARSPWRAGCAMRGSSRRSSRSSDPAPRRPSRRCAARAARCASGGSFTSTPMRWPRSSGASCDVIEREGKITLARLRDELQTSRKFAQALLEHLDAARVTRRAAGRRAGAQPAGVNGSSIEPLRASSTR